MHIVSSAMTQRSDSVRLFGQELRESLDVEVGGQRLQYQREQRQVFASAEKAETAFKQAGPALSEQTLQGLAGQVNGASTSPDRLESPWLAEPDEQSLDNLRMLLVALGRSVEDTDQLINGFKKAFAAAGGADTPATPAANEAAAIKSPAPAQSTAQLRYDFQVTQWQQQRLEVQQQGTLSTADGRTINFNLDLAMEHMQYSHQSVSLRAGAALKDPLVVNYANPSAQLQGQQMQFDLDADGQLDSMAMLANGSAYLALDRNGNDRIDNGQELFGAITGDGFAELAAYDQDGNGFIDAADAVFDDLRLWLPDASGNGRLLTLAEAGIGALGLQSVQGGFDLIADGQLQGQVRSTGMFLFEDGRVGSLQQVDLVV